MGTMGRRKDDSTRVTMGPPADPDKTALPLGPDVPTRGPDEVAALLFGDGEAPPPPSLDRTGTRNDARTPPVAPPTRELLPHLRVGEDLGRYRLVGEIGRGGMGAVYRANDQKLGRDVALKVLLLARSMTSEAIDRFQREALSAAALDHPNIIKVLDVGTLPPRHGGHPFYTMELLQGEDLADAIAGGRVPTRVAVEATRQVALALSYAHQRGVLHRDVKPQNVFLRRSETHAAPMTKRHGGDDSSVITGELASGVTRRATRLAQQEEVHALLLDFGLAKLVEGDLSSGLVRKEGTETVESLTRSGEILGTPVYMPPEQIRAARDLDARADIYGLGATLYHAVTGRPPFEHATLADLIEAVLQVDPLGPRALNSKVDEDLETLCMKCLAKDPKDRYATADDLAEDCRRYLAGEPLLARPLGWIGRLWRKAKRHRSVARLAAALAVTALTAIGLLAHYVVMPRVREAAQSRKEAKEQAGRKASAEALIQQARAGREKGDLQAAEVAAKRVVDDCTSWAEKGEDLPVSEAHEVLAAIANARQDPGGALVEHYRAFEQAVGTPRAAATLVGIGDQLLAMEQVEGAQGMYDRAIEERAEGRVAFEARLGLAKCLVGRMLPDEALAQLACIVGSPEMRPQEAREVNALFELAGLLTPSLEVPFSVEDYTVADFTGEGPQVAAISADGREVFVGRIADGAFHEASRLRVLSAEKFRLKKIAAVDLEGKGRPWIVVGGGMAGVEGREGASGGDGVVAVLALEGGKLVERARAPLCSDLSGRPFAAADLLGDGRRELIVGTSWYDRRVRLFRLGAEGRSLEPLGSVHTTGDVWGVLVRDADGDGRPEVWAFAGPWNAYALECMEWDPASKQMVLRSSTPFAREASIDPSSGRGDSGPVLVGAMWSDDSLRPLEKLLGRKELEETYRPPGVYEVRFRSDLKADLVPLTQSAFPYERGLGAYVVTLAAKGTRFAWTAPYGSGALSSREEEPTVPVRVLRREGEEWKPFAVLHPASPFFCRPAAFDLDGDGDTEVIGEVQGEEGSLGRIAALRILGLGKKPPSSTTRPVGASAAAQRKVEPRARQKSLQAAIEADHLGLDQEALRGYTQARVEARSQEDLEEAALGTLRCETRLGRYDEAARHAAEVAADCARARAVLDRALLDAMDGAGQWKAALDAARDLSTCAGLRVEEVRSLAVRIRDLERLSFPAFTVTSKDVAFRTWDLLATSPLFATLGKDGELTVLSGSATDDGLFVPIAYDRSGLRVRATVEVARHEWETNLEVGVIEGEPWAAESARQTAGAAGAVTPPDSAVLCALLAATGDSEMPVYRWTLAAHGGGRRKRAYQDALDTRTHVGTSTRVTLEHVPHQRAARWELLPAGGEARRATLSEVTLSSERVYLSVMACGMAGVAGRWGEFRIPELAFEAGGGSSRIASYVPLRAVDLVLLANGRWVQGRLEEARAGYDRAVQAADLEQAAESEAEARGLASAYKTRWGERYVRWASVDARFWRGLLRAEQGDAKGAEEDLAEAERRSKERFRRLLVDSALALQRRGAEAKTLRELLMREAGLKAPTQLLEFGRLLLEWPGGADLATALLADQGYQVREVLVVQGVRGEKGETSLAAGDRILSYDGRVTRDLPSLRDAQGDARKAGKTRVEVRVLRQDAPVRAEVDSTKQAILAQEGWEIVATRGK